MGDPAAPPPYAAPYSTAPGFGAPPPRRRSPWFYIGIIVGSLAAVFLVLLEITAIAVVCAVLRLPLSSLQILEAFAVTCVITLFILAVGNLSSLYNPRAVNPVKAMKTAAQSRSQALFQISTLPWASSTKVGTTRCCIRLTAKL